MALNDQSLNSQVPVAEEVTITPRETEPAPVMAQPAMDNQQALADKGFLPHDFFASQQEADPVEAEEVSVEDPITAPVEELENPAKKRNIKKQAGVNIEKVEPELLDRIESLDLSEFGVTTPTISSGFRGESKTAGLRDKFIKEANLDTSNLSAEAKTVVMDAINRRDSNGKSIYPSGGWGAALNKITQLAGTDVAQKVGNIRKRFGGFQSGHTKGSKVDMSESQFGRKLSKEELNSVIGKLKAQGLEVYHEPNQGAKVPGTNKRYDVFDIRIAEPTNEDATRLSMSPTEQQDVFGDVVTPENMTSDQTAQLQQDFKSGKFNDRRLAMAGEENIQVPQEQEEQVLGPSTPENVQATEAAQQEVQPESPDQRKSRIRQEIKDRNSQKQAGFSDMPGRVTPVNEPSDEEIIQESIAQQDAEDARIVAEQEEQAAIVEQRRQQLAQAELAGIPLERSPVDDLLDQQNSQQISEAQLMQAADDESLVAQAKDEAVADFQDQEEQEYQKQVGMSKQEAVDMQSQQEGVMIAQQERMIKKQEEAEQISNILQQTEKDLAVEIQQAKDDNNLSFWDVVGGLIGGAGSGLVGQKSRTFDEILEKKLESSIKFKTLPLEKRKLAYAQALEGVKADIDKSVKITNNAATISKLNQAKVEITKKAEQARAEAGAELVKQQLLGKYSDMQRKRQTLNEEETQQFFDALPKEKQKLAVKLKEGFEQKIKDTDYAMIEDSYSNLMLASESGSPAGGLAAIFSFMKSLDPTSVVREGEQALARAATSLPGKVQNAVNSMLNGRPLNETQLEDFRTFAAKRLIAKVGRAKKVAKDASKSAIAVGVPAQWVTGGAENFKGMASIIGTREAKILELMQKFGKERDFILNAEKNGSIKPIQ